MRSTRTVVGILADDLTGGADAAAPFLAGGMSVMVSRTARAPAPDSADVVACVSSSRDVPLPTALERVGASLAALTELRPPTLIKKVDSTLRGHLGPELALVRSLLEPALVIVAPSFPAHGRQLLGGRLVLDGRADEASPPLPDVLAASGIAAEWLSLDSLRSGSLGSVLSAAPLGTAFVCDAATDDDLSLIAGAGAAASTDRSVLWVGSAGLAAALARRIGAVAPRAAASRRAFADGPVLVVVGSVNARALAQAQVVASHPGTRLLPVELDVLLGLVDGVESVLAGYLAEARDVVLVPDGDVDPRLAADVARGLARLVASANGSYRGLVLTGGATAEAVLDELAVDTFELRGEIEIGVPLGHSESAGLAFVTKAGGFGDEALLERCRGALHDELRGTRS